jgi:hypothetical protein
MMQEMLNNLLCPSRHEGDLELSSQHIQCISCGVSFPRLKDGRPILIQGSNKVFSPDAYLEKSIPGSMLVD